MTKRAKTPTRTEASSGDRPAYIALPPTLVCGLPDEHHPFDADGFPIPVAASGQGGVLCTGHRYDLDHWASRIKDLWFDLAFMVEPTRSGQGGGQRTKSAEAPAPIDLDVAALRDHRNPTARYLGGDVPSVPGVIASWVVLLANRKPLRTFTRDRLIGWRIHPDGTAEQILGGEPRGLLPSSMIAQLDLLIKHHEWIAEQPWVGYYWIQLRQVHDALQAKVGDPSPAARSSKAVALEIVEAAAARRR